MRLDFTHSPGKDRQFLNWLGVWQLSNRVVDVVCVICVASVCALCNHVTGSDQTAN